MVQITEQTENNICLNLYIIHRSDFTKRKDIVEENIKALQKLTSDNSITLNHTYVEKYLFSELPSKIDEFKDKIKLESVGNKNFDDLLQNLHINHISNISNHIYALELIQTHIKSHNKDNIKHLYLILEDDIVCLNTIEQNFKNVLNHLAKEEFEYDLLFTGLPIVIDNEKINKNADKKIDNIEYKFIASYLPIIPSCDSYFISPQCVDKLLKEIYPIHYIYNIQLSYLMHKLQLKNYYITPNIFIEATKIGLLPSSININNAHIYSEPFMKMVDILNIPKDEFNKDVEKYEKEFNTLYETLKQHNNPDNLYLFAILHNKLNKHETALNIFKEAHKLYNNQPSNIVNESNFIKDYIATYKYLQSDVKDEEEHEDNHII